MSSISRFFEPQEAVATRVAELSKGKEESVQRDLQECVASGFWGYYVQHGGLNGFWTEHFATYDPEISHEVSQFEHDYLTQHPIPLAYRAVVKQTREELFSYSFPRSLTYRVASVACGTCFDVLGAKYSKNQSVSVDAFDQDLTSLSLAMQKADDAGITFRAQKHDALKDRLPVAAYNALVCNGFSFYVKDDEVIVELFEKMRASLVYNAKMVCSFILPPGEWQVSQVQEEKSELMRKVSSIYESVPAEWMGFRTAKQMKALAKSAGFEKVSVRFEPFRIHALLVAETGDGAQELWNSVQQGDNETARLLMAHNATVSGPRWVREGSDVPLMIAAEQGNVEMVRELLAHSDTDLYTLRNDSMETILHVACQLENVEMAREILKKFNYQTWYRDYRINGWEGGYTPYRTASETPLQIAQRSGNQELVTLLLSSGAKPE